MPELTILLKSMQEKEHRQMKFAAALEGVDLDKETKSESDFERIQRKAFGDDPETNDVANLQGPLAAKAGFGVGMGLGYESID